MLDNTDLSDLTELQTRIILIMDHWERLQLPYPPATRSKVSRRLGVSLSRLNEEIDFEFTVFVYHRFAMDHALALGRGLLFDIPIATVKWLGDAYDD